MCEAISAYCQLDPWEQTSVNSSHKTKNLFQENPYLLQNGALFSRPRCVMFLAPRDHDLLSWASQGGGVSLRVIHSLYGQNIKGT